MVTCLLGFSRAAIAQEKLENGGFETTAGQQAAQWSPYEQGYQLSSSVFHSGKVSAQCVNTAATDRRGASVRLQLNQTVAQPILVSGWSRAEGVSGLADDGYSLYIDLVYTDGTNLWGQMRPYSTGTHDWQQRSLRIFPTKPVRELIVYALFRAHSGTVWFDDFSAGTLPPGQCFDGQLIASPKLPVGATEGWYARDVAANSAILPLEKLGLQNVATGKGNQIDASIRDLSGKDRAITVYYVRRFAEPRPVWWNDIETHYSATVAEATNWIGVQAGAIGALSQYPLACVTGKNTGQAIGVPPDLGPRIVRFGYHPDSRLLYAAFDLALTAKAGDGKRTATTSVVRWPVDPTWGFRDAMQGYFRMFPQSVTRRAKQEGIWMPFTDPNTIDRPEDFGIAFHEGDNSITSDDRLGILSFRYSEPMTYWMSMAPTLPRTYADAFALLNQQAEGKTGSPTEQRQARAVLQSGAKDAEGKFQGEFRDTPWANGIAWVLSPNPKLPGADTKARINYTKGDGDKWYRSGSDTGQDGEYLDSVESWADVPNFRTENLRLSSVPPTFSTETHEPMLLTWFSVWEFSKNLSTDLHRRQKLLMGNTVPVRFFALAPLFDVMGIETNWISGDRWTPDDETTQRLRRTLSGPKPYLLLMNTDFDKLTPDRVESYFQQCMAWGIYPSMFSVDAASNPYWEAPRLYNRDRPLFKKYIPWIRQIAQAGWEPVPYARADKPTITIERFGTRFLTVRNRGAVPVTTKLTINTGKLFPKLPGQAFQINDFLTRQSLWQGKQSPVQSLSLTMAAQGVTVLELKQGRPTQ